LDNKPLPSQDIKTETKNETEKITIKQISAKDELRKAVVMSEILARPRAFRKRIR
jgi:hypothetical protein